MSRLSIVIPCLGGAADFDGTLVSVLQNRPPDCEVLVVHTEAYDDPYQLGDEVRFLQTSASSLVALLNTALEQASGDVLHIVGCGLEVTEGWTAAATKHFHDHEVGAVSPAIFDADRQTLLAAGVRWSPGGARRVVSDRRVVLPGSGRLRMSVLGPTLAAGFYRRDVLTALGGFDATIDASLADVAVALAIRSMGRLHVCEPSSQLVQLSPIAAPTKSSFHAGRSAERLFWRYAGRSNFPLALALHPWTLVGDAAGGSPHYFLARAAGRAAALLELGAARRHQLQLAAAVDRLDELAALRAAIRPVKKDMLQPSLQPSTPAPVLQRRAA